MNKQNKIQTKGDLEELQEESQKQTLPEQKRVFSVSDKIRRRVTNLPDIARPPLGYDSHKAFDRVFPHIRLPRLHPPNHGDTVIFNAPDLPANQLILGDNLQVLRTLPSESIDLIYIDPPFFSGRAYNVIWGDSNEVRTFYDIWEGGIDSYLIWLNARLWEMRRVLKMTGSIYVHCDWHANHYIKTEMDKIFGYENFANEITWRRQIPRGMKAHAKFFPFSADYLLIYTKTKKAVWNQPIRINKLTIPAAEKKYMKDAGGYFRTSDPGTYSFESLVRLDKEERLYAPYGGKIVIDYERREVRATKGKIGVKYYRRQEGDFILEDVPLDNIWDDIPGMGIISSEWIGYPTQKPEALLKRIIAASSNEGSVVADFFCGGGTTLAEAMKLKRRFIGCDSSRIAIAVTLDRLIKVGEEMSGVKSNISTKTNEVSLKKSLFEEEVFQMKLQAEGITEKAPNIEISYHGVYPIDKFESLSHEDFVTFVLTCYGASKNTAEGFTHGFRPPGQSEPVLVGPANPKEPVDAETVKAFFDEIKGRLEPNKLVKAKILAWRFSRQVLEYSRILRKYVANNNLPVELDLVTLDSREFRQHILRRFPNVEDAEFYLRFSKPPVLGDIRIKKAGPLEYKFEAIDTFSTNEHGWLVNCQWDFDYQEGHFSADKDYILSRKKVKDKKRGDRFEAILTAKHKFDKEGEYTIACKVQDNLAGESVISKTITV